MMNRKRGWASLLVFLMLLSFPMGSVAVKADSDEPIRFYAFTVYSPLNKTYNSRFLTLNLSFTAGLGIKYSLYYYIDGKYVDAIPYSVEGTEEMHVTYPAKGFAELPELSEGSHSLTVFLICSGLIRSLPSNNGTVYFTIDSDAPYHPEPPLIVDSTPPKISDISLECESYLTSDVPLNFTIDENTSRIEYSLDGRDNVTIAGNTTLSGLSAGAHNLTVYSWDDAGNVGESETVTFSVSNSTVETNELSEPLRATLCVAFLGASVVAVGAGLLIYLKKHKREAGKA